MNHYHWLEENINEFWLHVFGNPPEETGDAGIIGAHGDKGYQYRDEWEEAGIPFCHGMMLFLLTYTSLMDRPKWESSEWVIDNYPKYKEYLPPVD